MAGVEEPYFVFLSLFGETRLSVLAYWFEKSEAGGRPCVLDGHHQGLVHQLVEKVEYIGVVSDGLGRAEVEPAGEHRKTAEQCRLLLAQQVIRPADRVLEGSLPTHRRLGGCGEDPERHLELVGEVGEGESADPGCRQLDAKRDPVETAADPGNGLQLDRGGGEIRLHPGGPVEEETHRLRSGQVRPLPGQTQRRDPVHHLAGGPKGLPRCGQDRQALAGPEHLAGDGRSCFENVLTVVQ